MSACIRKCLLLDQQNVCWTKPKTAEKQTFSGEASTCAFHCRYIHIVNTRYIPDLILFFSKWPRLNRVNYGPKPKSLRWKMSTCGDGNFPLCRFFDEIFFSQRIYFQALQKKLFSSSSFSQSHSLSVIFWLALSNANCSFLPTQRSYCFALILQERSPKLFLWIYTLLRRRCCCCYRVSVCCVMMFASIIFVNSSFHCIYHF